METHWQPERSLHGGASGEDDELRTKDMRIKELEAMLKRYKDLEAAASIDSKIGLPGGHLGKPAQTTGRLSANNIRSTGLGESQLPGGSGGGASGDLEQQQQSQHNQESSSFGSNSTFNGSIATFDRSQWR